MGNVLSVITDQKQLNIERGTPVLEARFDNDKIEQFNPTQNITGVENINHELLIDNRSGTPDQGVYTTLSLQGGRSYVLNFDVPDNNNNFVVNISNSILENEQIEQGHTGHISFPFEVTTTGNYTLSFLTVGQAQGTFALDNIEILDVTGLTPAEVAAHSKEMPIFVPSVLSFSDYYPFGMMMPGRHANSGAYRYGFGGHENIDEIHNVTGSTIDMGDRWLDTRLGRTLKLDKEAHLYPNISPYSYVSNNPLNAIDPDGKVIIFINGQHAGDGGARKYWRQEPSNKDGQHADGLYFDNMVMNQIGDYKARYYDGASGGWVNTLVKPISEGNIIPGNRRVAGFNKAVQDAKSIIDNLEKGESIKIISHSYGGAYAKGFAQGLLKYAKEHDIDINIEFEVDFAPFQPGSQKAVKGVGKTIQVSHIHDNVSNTPEPNWTLWGGFKLKRKNREIEGADEVHYDPDPNKGHSIFDFADEIKKYVPKSNNNGTGSSTYEEKPENNNP